MLSGVEPEMTWTCPSCHAPLQDEGNLWQCAQKHSFDKAKEGYVNLLLAQHKNSKAPGDNSEMVQARREFLNQGHYAPLAQAIVACLQQNLKTHLGNESAFRVFDAGCGEGYYLRQVLADFIKSDTPILASGIDISKPAIQKAAKQNTQAQFAVASSYKLPLANSSQDVVIQVFAPSSTSEVKRVLKDTGIWLTVNPASDHLFELKQMVYDQAQVHDSNTSEPEGFTIMSQQKVSFKLDLPKPQQRHNLLMMTPFYWSISEDKKKRLLAELNAVTTDFELTVLVSA